ncbi:MAG: glycosyltransferase family 2 protein [Patescibacteria group bacterium]|nr:glycosyltransferase family 2 protein [Patescibacteria group bacterium]MDE2439115.1 glycosyltransferase family 2 protein [Patescibacteria group bacterium]
MEYTKKEGMDEIEKVVFAIPVFNAYNYLVGCLDSLDRSYPANTIILVNDASTDPRIWQHFEAYKSLRSRKTILANRSQRGWFTRAANTALKLALAETEKWLVILNSDCVVDPGSLEEMFSLWGELEQQGKTIGLMGCEGPQPRSHARYAEKVEPGYVTGHFYLFKKEFFIKEGFRFPQEDGEVSGFTAQGLFHIASDRALSYWMNRRGFSTIASYWAGVGHHGGRSWDHNVGALSQVRATTLRD